jgi:hypothetical protein
MGGIRSVAASGNTRAQERLGVQSGGRSARRRMTDAEREGVMDGLKGGLVGLHRTFGGDPKAVEKASTQVRELAAGSEYEAEIAAALRLAESHRPFEAREAVADVLARVRPRDSHWTGHDVRAAPQV